MIVSFCGHSHYIKKDGDERRLLDFLEETVGEKEADMFLGGYGEFDAFAYNCCKKYSETHKQVKLIYVTPYQLTKDNEKRQEQYLSEFDYIIYPEIEDKPLRYAITYRNKYMIECADCVVAYVSHSWGGAYTSYKYAKRLRKRIFNLAEFDG